MKHKIITIFLALLFPVFAHAQTANYWYPNSNNLQPIINTYGLQIPKLGSTGTPCVDIANTSGLFATTTCGGGGTNFFSNSGASTTLTTGSILSAASYYATSTTAQNTFLGSFVVGNGSASNNSLAVGNGSSNVLSATGKGSFAMGGLDFVGESIVASGDGSFAGGQMNGNLGDSITASGAGSFAFGGSNLLASSRYSTAFGTGITNGTSSSFEIGYGNPIFDAISTGVGINTVNIPAFDSFVVQGSTSTSSIAGYFNDNASSNGYAVYGNSSNGYAVYGSGWSSNGYAAITGNNFNSGIGVLASTTNNASTSLAVYGVQTISSKGTTISGSSGGSCIFYEPEAGASWKVVTFICTSLSGSVTYIIPVPFTSNLYGFSAGIGLGQSISGASFLTVSASGGISGSGVAQGI